MEPYTIIEIRKNGTTEPAVTEIEILLIQDGEVTVGLLGYDDENDPNTLYIDSPINEAELNPEAEALIKKLHPEHLKTQTSIVLVAPPELAEKMEW